MRIPSELTWIWEHVKAAPWTKILEAGEHLFKILAIMGAGLWAYYTFLRGRTFKPRLELSTTGNLMWVDGRDYLKVTSSLHNVGLSKIPLRLDVSALRIFVPDHSMVVTSFTRSAQWKRIATLDVFPGHDWIEPGETIQDQCLLQLAPQEPRTFRLQLRICSPKSVWYATNVVGRGAGTEGVHK